MLIVLFASSSVCVTKKSEHRERWCLCIDGWKENLCFRTTPDINECLLGASNCRGGERCINTEGSFRCQREVSCGTGYELTDNNNCKGPSNCPQFASVLVYLSHVCFLAINSVFKGNYPVISSPQISMSVRLVSITVAQSLSARTPRGRSVVSLRSSVVQALSRMPLATAWVSY